MKASEEMLQAANSFMLERALDLPWATLPLTRRSEILGGIYNTMSEVSYEQEKLQLIEYISAKMVGK